MDQTDQEIETPEVPIMRSTNYDFLFLPFLCVLLAGGIALGYYSQIYFRGGGTIPVFTKKTAVVPTEKPKDDSLKSLVDKQVLFDSLQNFDDLTREDLPNFVDVRLVEPYKGNKVVMGVGRIAVYDETKKMYTRMSDRTLSCAFSAALIGDTLYVGCNSEAFAGPHKIFEIDMPSGKITKAYLSTTFFGESYNAVNLNFATVGTMLWGSSWDGVFKYDTVTKKLTLYSYDDLHFPKTDTTWNKGTDCQKGFLYKEKDRIKVISQCDHTATYNEADDSWSTVHDPNNTLPPKINMTAEDFGLQLPSFYTFSDIRSEKRYLFTENEVHTLKKGFFPVKVLDVATDMKGTPPYLSYVSSDEKYAFIFSDFALGPHADLAALTLKDVASFTLIDFASGTTTDLIANSGLGKELVANYIRFGQYLDDSSFTEEGGNIHLTKNGEKIISVNTLEKKMTFTIPSPTPTP